LLFVFQITKERQWNFPEYRRIFMITLIAAFLFLALAAGLNMLAGSPEPVEAGNESAGGISALVIAPMIISGLALLLALFYAIRGLTWEDLRQNRAFSLIILLTTLILPQLAPFPVRMLKWDPLDYSWNGILRTGIFVIILGVIGVVVGFLWNRKLWLINAAIFYIPFTILYTTVFTNGQGFFSGLVGSLGYWLEQQGVERGSQPWYYYAFLQVPVYEFLPALGCLLAAYYAIRRQWAAVTLDTEIKTQSIGRDQLTAALLGFWVVSSTLAYTVAGEKMPWLTFHIALPMILLSGWALGKLIERIDWQTLFEKRGLLLVTLMIIFLISFSHVMASMMGDNPPFQGRELPQLNATNIFFTGILVAAASGWGIAVLLKTWDLGQVGQIGLLTAFAFLAILTARTAFRAAYINYDNATEYLVYAHSASGPKKALAQIEELSQRTTDGLAMVVAYDDETTYPYWWYLRNYPNAKFYGANPTRELRDAPVILVGDNNFAKIEPVVGQAYYKFDYIRIWWPNQDYYDMTWERIWNAITNRDMRTAIFQIWYNRDYTKYAEVTGNDMSLENWQPSDRMRLYVRKDVAAQVWNYGASPVLPEEIVADPYEGKNITLFADQTIGMEGQEPGQFTMPRDIAIAPDGSLYVSDTNNHRIQHLSADGEVLQVWGSFADSSVGEAPGGTFYEPWGIAVGPDGSVFVADTWNHRIQKFTPEGKYITEWGYFGQGESGDAFWGPRDIVVDSTGQVFVTDTGNKRVAIFDQNGTFITQFGSAGLLEGQFDEPVGIALGPEGQIYIADTWNQRIQEFVTDEDSLEYYPIREWEIVGWYGQSLDNKPYLAVDSQGYIYVSDPEGYRILQFNSEGEFILYWGDYGPELDGFILPVGVATDAEGGVWVADSGNNRILHFSSPPHEFVGGEPIEP
jgi:DNA-binding beta-propeller fold protein YncE